MNLNYIKNMEKKMRRYLLFAVGVAMLIGLLNSVQSNAQVYGEYDMVIVEKDKPYVELSGTNVQIPSVDAFKMPPYPNLISDPDDGYIQIDLGFDFEFNGTSYDKVWICINGFVTFSTPVNVRSTEPKGLFWFASNYPINVLAPYWGNHFYRRNIDNQGMPSFRRFKPSEISYLVEEREVERTDGVIVDQRIITVQWKDLNINIAPNPETNPRTQSIGNFQVKLYESLWEFTDQGDIEFCYGQVGGNQNTDEVDIETRGASIGAKGESNIVGDRADYLNGLINARIWVEQDIDDYDEFAARTSDTLTNDWQPSGASDRRITLVAFPTWKAAVWGDGDADISQVEGRPHAGMQQRRFVTPNDVRKILVSEVSKKILDSIRKREAYHADVNHDGRYFYDNSGFRRDIYWKNEVEADSIEYMPNPNGTGFPVPSGISSIKDVFYQANAYDAAIILSYIGAKIPVLPYWKTDSIPTHGRIVDENLASNIRFGKVVNEMSNIYTVPVYLNGYADGPVSFRFDVNGTITNVKAEAYGDNLVQAMNSETRVVFAANGEFNESLPVCYVTLETKEDNINFEDVRFNGQPVGTLNLNLTSVEEVSNEVITKISPNPFVENTNIELNIAGDATYNVEILDLFGNVVKSFSNTSAKVIVWDGTNNSGSSVSAGAYMVRVQGNELTKTMQIFKK
jgi:flagellar hook capping protein FlgD